MRKDISHKIAVVTSFNNKLFDKYAKRTIATYSWPFPLYVYSEDFVQEENDKIKEVRNIFELDPECKKFVDRNSYRPVVDIEHKREIHQHKAFLYDGVRFCYKCFALSHFILNDCKYKTVIWADADIVYTSKILTKEFIYENLNYALFRYIYLIRPFR